MQQIWLVERRQEVHEWRSDLPLWKTLAELNVCHSTFGICLQEHLDVGRGHVSLLVLIPAHSRPAVAFVFFYDVQQLALRHRDGAFIMAWERDLSISISINTYQYKTAQTAKVHYYYCNLIYWYHWFSDGL